MLHSNYVLHVNSTGRVVGKYNGTKEAQMVRLRRKLAADQKSALEKELNQDGLRPESAEPEPDPELETKPSPPQLPMVVEP